MNYTILAEICNLWRNYDDIQDSWDSVLSIVDWFFTNQDMLQPAAGPGHWNDPDMVRLGDGALTLSGDEHLQGSSSRDRAKEESLQEQEPCCCQGKAGVALG